jgi:hypothetical protein
MEETQAVPRRLTGTMFFALAMHQLRPDRFQEAFEKDYEFWEEILRGLVLRFLANSSTIVYIPALSRDILIQPFLSFGSPAPPEDNLEEYRSYQASTRFYHAFYALVQFVLERFQTTREVEVDPDTIPHDLVAEFEKAYIHHNSWMTIKKLDDENLRLWFDEIYNIYLPSVLDLIHAGQQDTHDFKGLCKDLLIVLTENRLSFESIKMLQNA